MDKKYTSQIAQNCAILHKKLYFQKFNFVNVNKNPQADSNSLSPVHKANH